MKIKNQHLTYCTNIHPGESWTDTFDNLKKYLPGIREKVGVEGPFAIGLRLSNEASLELEKENHLNAFSNWLQENDFYVFTFNGFPYGGFHRQVVKDEVHQPDWTTSERRDYTNRLFTLMSQLLPLGMDGGISTSPLSYRHWHQGEEALKAVWEKSTSHLIEVVAHLHQLHQQTGKLLHLDIEPEPDGMIENADETIYFFKEWLLKNGAEQLQSELGGSVEEAKTLIKSHIRICYDVCHFAVVYSDHSAVLRRFKEEGIGIGKFQLSAALKVSLLKGAKEKGQVKNALLPFAESTYLHQVVAKSIEGEFSSYKDLPEALHQLDTTKDQEWRIHFHVPIFLSEYGNLQSTQEDILQVLSLNLKEDYTPHLEVETYTWEVLPEDIHLSLSESIARELQWVLTSISSYE
ncbi:metabolite traffic protein EboE [Pleomorphovibrio marinus]|uniref:metabolite traffic protein EboE n=1 Tax=Pleomorphovibrio marinus TaxID=2164132 RepID=UPI000E0BF60B|nr:metabolite traffic protein EboE [Pleomorphovibrio marinus]